jgi:hypothetical protein
MDGVEIQRRRQLLVWSQKRLAREMKMAADPRTRGELPSIDSMVRRISAHENGHHPPRPLYVELYRRVFAKYGHLFSEEEQRPSGRRPAEPEGSLDLLSLAWTVGKLNTRVNRRGLLRLAGAVGVTVMADPAERLMRALAGDHRVDEAGVAHLEDRTRGFHRLEEHYPAAVLYPALLNHLADVSALLERNPPDKIRRRLAVVAGESAVLASWFAWERGDRENAARNRRLAYMAAQHADDIAVSACMDGYRTYMANGDHRRGAAIASAALERQGLERDPATHAWLLGRHAEERARLGDVIKAREAIHQAEEVYEMVGGDVRPWMYFFDPARFASMRLAVYSRTRDENEAVQAIDDVRDYLGPDTEKKKHCVVDADLALARYWLGDITEAVKCARSSLAATAELAFPLGWERLDQVVTALAPATTRVARDFRSEYAATRPASAPPSLP